MRIDIRDYIRLNQNGLDQVGHSPGALDRFWSPRTSRAVKPLLATKVRAASVVPPEHFL